MHWNLLDADEGFAGNYLMSAYKRKSKGEKGG